MQNDRKRESKDFKNHRTRVAAIKKKAMLVSGIEPPGQQNTKQRNKMSINQTNKQTTKRNYKHKDNL